MFARLFFLTTTLSVSIISSAVAQKDIQLVEIEEVVVTGEKNEVSKKNAVRKIKVIGSEQIKQSSAINLSDLLRTQLNIRISNDPILGGGLSMNGMGGNNLKIMVDGVPLVGRLNGEIDLTQIQIDQYERIEIVEGPLAVEYGTNSLAGTINLITSQSSGEKASATAKVRYESVGVYAQTASLSGGKGRCSGKLQLSHNSFDGWSSSDENWDWIEDYYADSARVNTWNPKVQKQASASGKIILDNVLILPRVDLLSENIQNKGYPRAPYGESAFDDEYDTQRFIHSVNIKSYGDNELKWDVLASYQRYNRTKSSFNTDLTTLQRTPLSAEMQDTTRVTNYMTRGTRHVLFFDGLTARIGWDISQDSFQGKRIANSTMSMSDIAAFSILEHQSTSSVQQLGLRKAYNSAFKTPLLPSYNALLKLGDFRYRISYAKGFRSPSLKELHFIFVDLNHQIFGNENLIPETSNYLQASASFSRKNEASVRVFYNNVRDQISLVDQLDGTFRYVNFYSFISRGLEWSVSQKHKSISTELGISFIGRKNTLFLSEDTNNFTYTPELSCNVSYNITKNTNLNANYKFNGSRERFVDDGDGEVESVKSSPYSILDTSVSFTSNQGRYAIQFGAKNLFNVTTINSAQSSSAHGAGVNWVAWGRSYVVSFSIVI